MGVGAGVLLARLAEAAALVVTASGLGLLLQVNTLSKLVQAVLAVQV